MIGLSSIWPKLFFLLVFSGFLTAFIKSWSAVARKKAATTGKLLFLSAFFLLWAFMFIQLFVREALFHHDLSGLRVDTLKSIEVGTRSINAPEDISKIVRSLNEAQWFEVNHGGWSAEVPLVLQFRSGTQRTYHVAWYERGQGAVVISQSNFDHTGARVSWSNGFAFCPLLPRVLATGGIDLPRVEREPRATQPEETGPRSWRSRILPIAIFGFFTLGALRFFLQLIKGKTPESKNLRIPDVQNAARTLLGLVIVSIIAAGFGLRLMYALFDWRLLLNFCFQRFNL
jgi:hypothetical protein